MKVFAAAAVAVVALLFATGHITFYYSSGATESDGGSTTVREVLAVISAGSARRTDVAAAQFRGLVNRVASTPNHATLRLFEREWRRLWPRMDRELGRMSSSVARTTVTTAPAKRCRVAALNSLARQRVVLQHFNLHVMRTGARAAGVKRLVARLDGYPLEACTNGMTTADRAAVEAALG